jgi:hypothetical protein
MCVKKLTYISFLHHLVKFCSDDVTKCELAGANFTCVAPTKEEDGCIKDVADGKADLMLASANDMVKNG